MTQDEATSETGQLRLVGASRGYNKTVAISTNFIANPAPDDTGDVHFENVPTNDKYSLTYIGGDGSETQIVSNAAYHSLNDDSLPEESSGSSGPDPTPNPSPQS